MSFATLALREPKRLNSPDAVVVSELNTFVQNSKRVRSYMADVYFGCFSEIDFKKIDGDTH